MIVWLSRIRVATLGRSSGRVVILVRQVRPQNAVLPPLGRGKGLLAEYRGFVPQPRGHTGLLKRLGLFGGEESCQIQDFLHVLSIPNS